MGTILSLREITQIKLGIDKWHIEITEQKRPEHMMLEIQVLVWGQAQKCGGVKLVKLPLSHFT